MVNLLTDGGIFTFYNKNDRISHRSFLLFILRLDSKWQAIRLGRVLFLLLVIVGKYIKQHNYKVFLYICYLLCYIHMHKIHIFKL